MIEFLSFYNAPCFSEFVFLLIKHFIMYVPCLLLFLPQLNYALHCKLKINHSLFIFCGNAFIWLVGWGTFYRSCKVIGFLTSYSRELFLD